MVTNERYCRQGKGTSRGHKKMNDLARRFEKEQKKLGLSLRKIGGNLISQQALSNYQRGLVLPSKAMLPKLAECYKMDIGELTELYNNSIIKYSDQPIQEKPFFDLLKMAGDKDHIVIIEGIYRS